MNDLLPRIALIISLFIFSLFIPSVFISAVVADQPPLKVGWIGAVSGPIAKYGAYQSAILAEEHINAGGGVSGRRLELVFEDGKGEGRAAASAAQKLISFDKVNYIIGGHCSPESLAIAPIAERSKVIMLAAITSNPKLTSAGDHIFRLTAVSTKHADLLAPFALEQLKLTKFAVLHEETDYAGPPAERFAELVEKAGAEVVDLSSYNPSTTDFRSLLARIKAKSPQGLYLGVQSPDAALIIMQQIHELKLSLTLFGNEVTGNAVSADPGKGHLFNGLIFAEPPFDLHRPETKQFLESYRSKFKVESLPFGFWSAEAYDAVRLLADTIARCGDEVEAVKKCLYQIRDYPGVSAPVSIDQNGDGVREYLLKKIMDGKVVVLN